MCNNTSSVENNQPRLSLRFFLLIQLPRIDDIMPDAVETSHYGGDGIEEDETHPDDEDCVFLSESLSCRDGAALLLIYVRVRRRL